MTQLVYLNVLISLYEFNIWLDGYIWWKFCVNSPLRNPLTDKNADVSNTYFPRCIWPKVLGIIEILFGKCEANLCVIFDQKWLLSSPMDAVFAQTLSYCWIMNTDLNWGLQFFRCCSGFFYDLIDESTLRSWSNCGRPVTPGKVHHCYKFSLFVDNGSYRGSLESQILRNGFITLSRRIHVNYFVSHMFLNFFRSWHDVLLFKHASLCQTGFDLSDFLIQQVWQ